MKYSDEDDEDSDGKLANNGHESMDVHVEYSSSSGFDYENNEEDWERDEEDPKYTNGDSLGHLSSFGIYIVNNQKINNLASPDMDAKVNFPGKYESSINHLLCR